MATGRPILNVAMDEETADQVRAIADYQGVSVTALIEALVRSFVRSMASGRLPKWARDALDEARHIDAERRRRR